MRKFQHISISSLMPTSSYFSFLNNLSSWAWSSSFNKDERFQSQTLPVKCLDTSLAEGKLSCAKEIKDVETFDASSAENKPETPTTQREKNAASKTVCVRNLSFDVERAEIESIFKDCGVVVDVRLHVDVDFATGEATEKALELDYTRLIAPGEGERFRNRSSSIQFQKCESFQPLTVFVSGFNTSLAEEKIKASLHNHFKSCGEIARITLPRNRDFGAIRYAHLDFKDIDGYKKALQLNQTTIGGYWVSVVKAEPKHRRDNQDIGGGRSGYHVSGRDGSNYRRDNHGIGGGAGGYRVSGRNGANYNQGMGAGRGGYHAGGRGGGDYGGRASWVRSYGVERHWTAKSEH